MGIECFSAAIGGGHCVHFSVSHDGLSMSTGGHDTVLEASSPLQIYLGLRHPVLER
jgi:hypothetical protein